MRIRSSYKVYEVVTATILQRLVQVSQAPSSWTCTRRSLGYFNKLYIYNYLYVQYLYRVKFIMINTEASDLRLYKGR